MASRYIKVEKKIFYLCDSCKNMGYIRIEQTSSEPETVKCWNCKAKASPFANSTLVQRIQAADSSCFREMDPNFETEPRQFLTLLTSKVWASMSLLKSARFAVPGCSWVHHTPH